MKFETDRIVSIVLAIVAFVIVSTIFGALFGAGAAVVAYLFGTEIYAFILAKYVEVVKKKP